PPPASRGEGESALAAPHPGPPSAHPERAGEAGESKDAERGEGGSPVIIFTLLGLGSILVLTGALWLVAQGWDAIGAWGRFALLCGLTGTIAAAGRALESRGHARSGLSLLILASQLLWAVGADLLVIRESVSRSGAWAFVAVLVSGVSYLLALRRRSAVVAVLASLGALMAVVFTWQALDDTGHTLLLGLATAGLAASAVTLERRNHPAAPAVHFVWTQLLWADGAFFLRAIGHESQAWPWAIVAAAAALTGLWVAARRDSILFSILGTLAAVASLALTGSALSTGRPEGPAEWSLISAAALALLAFGLGTKTSARVAALPAVAAALHALGSVFAALSIFEEAPSFSRAWPYAVGLAAVLNAIPARRSKEASALATMIALVAFVASPLFHARSGEALPPDLVRAALGLGLVLCAASALLGRLPLVQTCALAVGCAHVSAWGSNALTVTALAAPLLAIAWQRPGEWLGLAAAVASAGAVFLWGEPFDAHWVFSAEWALLGAAILAAVAFVARRRPLARSFGALAGVFVIASLVASLAARRVAPVFSVAWPYGLALLSVLAARLATGEGRRVAVGLAALVLTLAPLYHAFSAAPLLEGYRRGAPVAALVLLGLAFLRRGSRHLLAATVVAVAHAAASRSPALTVAALAVALLAHDLRLSGSALGTFGAIAAGAALFLGRGELSIEGALPIAAWNLGAAVALALVAALAKRLQVEEAGIPLAFASALFLFGSWLASLGMLEGPPTPAADLWPLLLAAVGLGAALLARAEPYRAIALAPSLGVIAAGPLVVSLRYAGEPVHLYYGTMAGGALLVLAFKWETLASRHGLQVAAILAGLAAVGVAPVVLALLRLGDQNGDALFLEVLDPKLGPAERLGHRLFQLPYLVMTSGVLVGLGVLFSRSQERKLPYRLLEVAGLAIFFGTLSLLSFLRWSEYLYPTVLVAGAVAAIAVGALARQVLLVVGPSVALVIQVWFQYFAKLYGKAPLALLIIGFGLSLLVGAVVFERKVKPRLGEMERW
ncbi:MAG TPA: DUF2157 domain-containing protein, partial [Planctomycetota bacterium]|nr:DUF2157 domain-containing protein [Planctomycetota bacterium]